MREDLIERLRREADISARPGQMDRLNALADEFAAALGAAREDVKAVGTVLGGEFHYLRVAHGLPDGTMLYAIDPPRGEGAGHAA